MSKQIEALKMAIEALESIELLCDDKRWYLIGNARKSCKEALAEAEKQEPVAWMEEYQSCKVNGDERLCHSDKVFRLVQVLASQLDEWQSLSDDEIAIVIKTTFPVNVGVTNVDLKFARAIEAKLKEKNHG